MARPTTKTELIEAANTEFDRLRQAVANVEAQDRELPGACDDWSVKDLLAHLHAWHELALGWEAIGRTGEVPAVPAEGYTFAETPKLNAAIHKRTAQDRWDDVERRLRASHDAVLAAIDGYTNAELFTKKQFAWTRSTSVGAYFVSATSSHYAWASKLVRKWTKLQASARRSD